MGQQQFAARLLQPVPGLLAADSAADPIHHRPRGPVPLGDHPGIALVEPIGVVAPLPPAGGGRLAELKRIASAEGLPQGGQTHPLTRRLLEQLRQELGTFKPPMAKELRIKGGDQERSTFHRAAEVLQLLRPARQEVLGIALHGGGGLRRVVGLLGLEAALPAGDAMELEPKGARAGDAALLELLLGEIPAQIAVEFAVAGIAGVALPGTPDGQGRFAIPAEKGHPAGTADRCIDPIAGPRLSMQQAVGIEDRVAQPAADQQPIQPLVVGAFRKPDPQGPHPQQAFVLPHGRQQLRPHGFGAVPQQWQIAVGGTAGQQVEDPLLLQRLKARQHITLRLLPGLLGPLELQPEAGRGCRMVLGCLAQELLADLQPGDKALTEDLVAQ